MSRKEKAMKMVEDLRGRAKEEMKVFDEKLEIGYYLCIMKTVEDLRGIAKEGLKVFDEKIEIGYCL